MSPSDITFRDFMLLLPMSAQAFPGPLAGPVFSGGRTISELESHINEEILNRCVASGWMPSDISRFVYGFDFEWIDPSQIDSAVLEDIHLILLHVYGYVTIADFEKSTFCAWLQQTLFPAMARAVERANRGFHVKQAHDLPEVPAAFAQFAKASQTVANFKTVTSEEEFISQLLDISDLNLAIGSEFKGVKSDDKGT